MDDLHERTISETKVVKLIRDEVKSTTPRYASWMIKCVKIDGAAFCLSLHMKQGKKMQILV